MFWSVGLPPRMRWHVGQGYALQQHPTHQPCILPVLCHAVPVSSTPASDAASQPGPVQQVVSAGLYRLQATRGNCCIGSDPCKGPNSRDHHWDGQPAGKRGGGRRGFRFQCRFVWQVQAAVLRPPQCCLLGPALPSDALHSELLVMGLDLET